MEEWRKIADFDNYSVSSYGQVRNDKTGKILKDINDKNGYTIVNLYVNKNKITKKVHRLVGTAFLDNQENLEQIDHINRVKNDNRMENLRWCLLSNNQRNKNKWGTGKYTGITLNKKYNKWRVIIKIDYKSYYIGMFSIEEEALVARNKFLEEKGLLEYYNASNHIKESLSINKMESEDLTEIIEMPIFSEVEGEVELVKEVVTEPEKKKRGRKPAADKKDLTPEEKKEQMNKYYIENKEHRMLYKKAQREAGKVDTDVMVLTVEPIPQYLDNQGKKKVTNLDYLRYNGAKRTLTITQPSERLLNVLRAMEYDIDEQSV